MQIWAGLLLVVSVSSCAQPTARGDRILVDISGQPVTVADFDQFVASSVQKDQPFLAGDVMQALLDQFIEEQLLLRAADEVGVTADREKVQNKVAVIQYDDSEASTPARDHRIEAVVERQLRIQSLVEDHLFSNIEVTDEEVENHYETNRAFFHRPETVSFSQILVEARDEAESIQSELRAEPSRFEELAEQHSVGPEAERSGYLGFFARGELPPGIEETVFSMTSGPVSEIIETDFGFHIFRVDERVDASELPLDAVRDKIRVDLLRGKSESELARYIEDLKKKYPVTVYREHLSFAFLEWEDGKTAAATTEESP